MAFVCQKIKGLLTYLLTYLFHLWAYVKLCFSIISAKNNTVHPAVESASYASVMRCIFKLGSEILVFIGDL